MTKFGTASDPRFQGNRLRNIAKLLFLFSNEMGERKAPEAMEPLQRLDEDADMLVVSAAHRFSERRRRAKFLPANLFADPAWDILLYLYASGRRGHDATIAAITMATQLRPIQVQEWLFTLRAESLVEEMETSEPMETQRPWQLTKRAQSAMNEYLAESLIFV